MDSKTFYHTTVLLQEAVDGLNIQEDGVYVDATFGGGGHSGEILKRLSTKGRLIAFDQDEDAWSNKPDDTRLIDVRENFRYMKQFLKLHRQPQVDGILADLGVSSFQFDTAQRGFSTRFEGALDMRMDRRAPVTAEKLLQEYSEQQLHKMLEQNGEVRNAKQLAKHIVMNRMKGGLSSIEAFKAMITPVMKGLPNKYLAQVFQALRIEVNDELGALKDFLKQAEQCLKPGGRLSVITFHSLEDRIVKQFIKKGDWEEQQTDIFGNVTTTWTLKAVNNKPIEPSEEEQKNNPRSRSARLRIAAKL
ncbi:MAG TPA: 16S rRNA (cytosine(1402)-N(4))-methyltransferase RsmH [Flavipsychrobacter sp.]|nr:16S rRNA (cytosine(1402)-N(4))-methyltransferase RsmH [Flavipsychrobacter sp.]